MKTIIWLAWRGLLRNTRRSLVAGTTITLSGLVLLLSLFLGDGITDGIIQKLVAIESGTVLVTVSQDDDAFHDPAKHSRLHSDVQDAIRHVGSDWRVRARLRFSGMLFGPNGETFNLTLKGIEPQAERDLLQYLAPAEGRALGSGGAEILLSQAVADELHVHAGDRLTLVSNTWGDQVNALDLTVVGVFANVAPWADYVGYTDLQTAQKMWGASIANQYLVDGPPLASALPAAERIRQALSAAPVVVKTYQAAGGFQLGIANANRYTFLAFSIVLLLVVALGIASLISITVRERAPEFGTMLALGFQSRQLLLVLLLEVLLLAALATGVAILLGGAGFAALAQAGIALDGVARNAFGTATLMPAAHPYQFAAVFLICVLMSAGGAFWPALRILKLHPDDILRNG